MRRRTIAVIGSGCPNTDSDARAREVGRLLALAGCTLVTGGLRGVMEAASAGFQEGRADLPHPGVVVGIVPGASPQEANLHVDIAIATGMGEARNCVLVNSAEAFIAVGGEFGTLSEIAFALKQGKRVVSLGSWEVDPAILRATSPEEAVQLALAGCP